MRWMRSMRAMVAAVSAASMVVAAGCGSQPVVRPETVPVSSGQGLVAVARPAGETVAPSGGEAPSLPWGARGVGLPGHKVDLAHCAGDACDEVVFLRATANGGVVWEMTDPPATRGAEFDTTGEPAWAVFFLTQSMIGTWVLAATTGTQIDGAPLIDGVPLAGMDGYRRPVIAPDRTWAVLAPWYSDFSECYAQELPLRVALTTAEGGHPVAAATPVRVACSAGVQSTEPTASAMAIAPSGALYAYAYRDAQGAHLEVFRASDDARVAVVDQGVAAFDRIAFSASGRYLVVTSTDGGRDALTWYRIDAP